MPVRSEFFALRSDRDGVLDCADDHLAVDLAFDVEQAVKGLGPLRQFVQVFLERFREPIEKPPGGLAVPAELGMTRGAPFSQHVGHLRDWQDPSVESPDDEVVCFGVSEFLLLVSAEPKVLKVAPICQLPDLRER